MGYVVPKCVCLIFVAVPLKQFLTQHLWVSILHCSLCKRVNFLVVNAQSTTKLTKVSFTVKTYVTICLRRIRGKKLNEPRRQKLERERERERADFLAADKACKI